MIDLYIGLRVNQFAIICGPEIDGKSTIWKVIVKAINSIMSANNPVNSYIFHYSLQINITILTKGKRKQRDSEKIFAFGQLFKRS